MKLTNKGMGRIYRIYTLLVVLIPFLTMFFCMYSDGSAGATMSFWAVMCLIVVVVAFKDFCIKFFGEYRVLSLGIIFLIIGLITHFLGDKLIWIGLLSIATGIVSLIISRVGDVYDEHAYVTESGEKVMNKQAAMPQKEAWKEAYFFNLTIDKEE